MCFKVDQAKEKLMKGETSIKHQRTKRTITNETKEFLNLYGKGEEENFNKFILS